MRDLLGPRIKPVSPELARGFLTTRLASKSQDCFTLMSVSPCSLRASPCGLSNKTVGLTWRIQEAAFKAWAGKCPHVTSSISYGSSCHRACDGKSDKEVGVIFNVPKVGIKISIFTSRAVRIKLDNACRGWFTVKLMKLQPRGSLIARSFPSLSN